MASGLHHALAVWLAWLAMAPSARLDAQPATIPSASPSNRYLLIVETSQAMEARERGMLKVAQDLLTSGMGGQMKAGDTLGVWIYNADLYAGRFPLQRWSPEQQKTITAGLLKFLKGQKYEKEAALGRVLPAMEQVVKDSHLITVILVSTGDGAVQGTPFDDRINEFFQRWQDKQKSAKMPYVIVLRAKAGEVVDYTLNLPPWPVQMPFLPTETQVAAAPPQEATPATPSEDHTPPATPPLIVSRKEAKPLDAPKIEKAAISKPAPPAPDSEPAKQEKPPLPPTKAEKVEAPKAETPIVKVEAPAPAPAATTNAPLPVKAEEPKPETPAKETAKAEPAPTAPPKPAPEPLPAQTPAAVQPATPRLDEAPKAETVKAPAEKPPVEAPAPVLPPPPKADTVKAAEPKPPQAAPVQVAAAPSLPVLSNPVPAVVESPQPAPAPQPKPEAVSAPPPPLPGVVSNVPVAQVKPVPPPSPRPAAKVTATNAAPASVAMVSNPPAPSPSPITPAQTAVVTPAESFLRQKTTWIAGIVLLGVAFAFGWLTLRRSRAAPHASLITRSLDREKRK